jgi:multidrug efflux pump subunit AcrA (membrane-fusion protein)
VTGNKSFAVTAALTTLICLSDPAMGDGAKGGAAVKVQDRNLGLTPELIDAYGMVVPTSSAQITMSFQRDGVIADIYVKVGDQFKKGDKLLTLKDSEILTATFDGVVTAISVNKGDRFFAAAPLMTLLRRDLLVLIVWVEPPALAKVKPDQPAHLTPLSSDCKPTEGKVKRIGVAIDPKTGQVPVFIELPDGIAGCGENFKAVIEVGNY